MDLQKITMLAKKCYTIDTFDDKQIHITAEQFERIQEVMGGDERFLMIGDEMIIKTNIRHIAKRKFHEWDRQDFRESGISPVQFTVGGQSSINQLKHGS